MEEKANVWGEQHTVSLNSELAWLSACVNTSMMVGAPMGVTTVMGWLGR